LPLHERNNCLIYDILNPLQSSTAPLRPVLICDASISVSINISTRIKNDYALVGTAGHRRKHKNIKTLHFSYVSAYAYAYVAVMSSGDMAGISLSKDKRKIFSQLASTLCLCRSCPRWA